MEGQIIEVQRDLDESHAKEESGKDLRPYHVHGFWRSMEYRKPPEVDKWEDHDAADRALLEGQVQKVCEKGAPSVRALSRLIRSEFQPETDGLKEPKESDAPRGRPRKKATARDPSWFEHEGVRTTPNKCKYDYYMQFIPEELHHLVRSFIDVDGDGHCGFRCVSYAIYPGNQDRYLEMRQNLIDHITVYWGSLYHNVYSPTTLQDVRTRLGWLSPTPCLAPYWLHNWDLCGYATLYNRAFVVFGKWGPNGPSYGETFLPMAHAFGTAPDGVTYLVCTGQHWIVLDLADVEGLVPIPEPSMTWTTWASWETTTDWANLYAAERNMYHNLGP
ncbi:hypothetical protein LINGRAHAP2_LOCUS11557 [Linum grandiflorum]